MASCRCWNTLRKSLESTLQSDGIPSSTFAPWHVAMYMLKRACDGHVLPTYAKCSRLGLPLATHCSCGRSSVTALLICDPKNIVRRTEKVTQKPARCAANWPYLWKPFSMACSQALPLLSLEGPDM